MNELPLHPKIAHLPIALSVLLPLLAAAILFAWWRGWFRQRTWSLVVAGQALLLATGVAAVQTGEADEDRVERVVPHAALERHEHAAKTFQLGAGVVLALCLVPLLIRRPGPARLAAGAAFVGTLVVLALGYRVGQAGGELIYHYPGASVYTTAGGDAAPPAMEPERKRRHDEDR